VFDEELAQAEALVRAMAQGGVDAVIVQDVGLVTMIKRVAPNLTIHGKAVQVDPGFSQLTPCLISSVETKI